MWGVGCIFVEMITGVPTFPGVRETYDQLDKIFKVSKFQCFSIITELIVGNAIQIQRLFSVYC